MANALLGGAVAANVVQPQGVVIAEPDREKWPTLQQKFAGCQIVDDPVELLSRCDRVVLAVKPHVLRAIAPTLARNQTPEHLFVSIAAGVSLDELQTLLSTERVIRVMPNTPCLVRAGASAVAASDSVAENDIAWAEMLFRAVGLVVRVPDDLLHAVTGVSGSGPAYLYLVIEALSDGGVSQGLPRDIATRLAAQTVLGAAQMVLETGTHPGQLKDQVTSPSGTTIAALRTLEEKGVRSAMIEAVARCAQRSRELGKAE
ncbi:MAG: pyrroline-5-carboxylate reductase [Planctomycetota bacterium]|nr:MAG: pyrroline-5-carboxylate reductase [Planctomycetota bacterium]